MSWSAADIPDQTGRRIVVTGANAGIGLETVRELTRRGADVVMVCRNEDRAREAAAEIREDVPEASLSIELCDLGDLSSVSSCAERLSETPIDVLINNAGVMAIPRRETTDGFERQFGVNHLGHFALTGQVLAAVADDGRIVTVSSGAHTSGSIDFDDLHGQEAYDPGAAYSQSKLANILFAYELDRRLRTAGSDIRSVAVRPGYVATDLHFRGPRMKGSRLRMLLGRIGNATIAQSPAAGALSSLRAATDPAVEGGTFYGPGGLFDLRGPPEQQRSAPQSYNEATAARLWSVSEELTAVSFELAAN